MWVYLIKNRVIVWKWRSVETFICAAPVFRVSRFQFYSIFMWKLNSIVFVGRRRHPFKLRLQTWRYGFIIVLRLHSDSQIYILLRRAKHSVEITQFYSHHLFVKKFCENNLYCKLNWWKIVKVWVNFWFFDTLAARVLWKIFREIEYLASYVAVLLNLNNFVLLLKVASSGSPSSPRKTFIFILSNFPNENAK